MKVIHPQGSQNRLPFTLYIGWLLSLETPCSSDITLHFTPAKDIQWADLGIRARCEAGLSKPKLGHVVVDPLVCGPFSTARVRSS
jgi:hypothetical protein